MTLSKQARTMGEERWRVRGALYAFKAQEKFTLAGEERQGDSPPHAPGLEDPHPDRHTPKVLRLVPTCKLVLNHINTSSWLRESVA